MDLVIYENKDIKYIYDAIFELYEMSESLTSLRGRLICKSLNDLVIFMDHHGMVKYIQDGFPGGQGSVEIIKNEIPENYLSDSGIDLSLYSNVIKLVSQE